MGFGDYDELGRDENFIGRVKIVKCRVEKVLVSSRREKVSWRTSFILCLLLIKGEGKVE